MGYTWVVCVFKALINVARALFSVNPMRRHHEVYIVNLFYYLDILGNAVCGGSYRITVSARVGCYSWEYGYEPTKFRARFWMLCEYIIDSTFYPLDGKNHCFQAFIHARENVKDENNRPAHIHHGPEIFFLLLITIIILSCAILWPLFRLVKLLRLV